MYSSYSKNNFEGIIHNTVIAFPPSIAVELGVLEGYSTVAISKALCLLKEMNGSAGHLHSYDLWEDYPYRHSTQSEVQKTIDKSSLSEFVTLYKKDAFIVHEDYNDKSVDLLHVDLSNSGDIFNDILEKWTPKMRHCGLILFEGGSEERDNIDWMKKYNKKPIRPEINRNRLLQENYIYGTYSIFPSMTVMKKVTL